MQYYVAVKLQRLMYLVQLHIAAEAVSREYKGLDLAYRSWHCRGHMAGSRGPVFKQGLSPCSSILLVVDRHWHLGLLGDSMYVPCVGCQVLLHKPGLQNVTCKPVGNVPLTIVFCLRLPHLKCLFVCPFVREL